MATVTSGGGGQGVKPTAGRTGAVKYYTYRQQVKLGPNQSLHFKAGRGYYAGPRIYQRGVYYAAAPTGYAPTGGSYVSSGMQPGWGTGYGYTSRANRYPAAGGAGGFRSKAAAGGGGGGPAPPPAPFSWGNMGPLTPAQIEAQAEAEARGQLLPQQQEIQRQQALAAQQAQQQEAAIKGFSDAAAQIEAGMAPQISSAYQAATQEVGQLGQGLATGVAQDVAAQQASDAQLAAAQGQTSADTTSTPALHDTIYGTAALIPGQSLAMQGAAATESAARAPQIQLNAGAQQLSQAMADAKSKNDDYAQQLIQLAQQFPGLKAQALDALNKYEVDKANYRQSVIQFQEQHALQVRAELANEAIAQGKAGATQTAISQRNRQLSLEQQRINKQYKYEMAGLRFRNQQAANKAALLGKQIDVGQSKLMGYVIYKDGTYNKSIKVAKDVAAGSTAKGKARATALNRRGTFVNQAMKGAFAEATKLRGTLVKKTSRYGQGTWNVAPGFKSEFNDGTTSIQAHALRSGRAASYQEAFQQVWGAINADALETRFGYTHSQAVNMVRNQMIRAGWAPPRYQKQTG